MEPEIQYARSADGTSLAFFEAGSGTPLIVSPNLWNDLAAAWHGEPLAQLVREGFHVVHYDMRGMGMSERNVRDFSLDAQVADIEALADRLGFERFALFGFVHGSPPCIAYAASRPERLTHLILSVPFANGDAWYRASPTLHGLEAFRAFGDEQWQLYTLTHATALAEIIGGGDVVKLAAVMRESTTPDTLHRYLEALRLQDLTPVLSAVQAPTLVCVRRDSARPADDFARRVGSGIPAARLVTVDSAALAAPSLEETAHITRFVLGRET